MATPQTQRNPVARRVLQEVIWAALVALGSASPLIAVLAAGRTLVWGDTAVLFWPIRSLVVDAIREFRLPLWNPYEAMGLPLQAQMIHGALHPFSVLAALLAPDAGTDPLIVGNVVFAALGAGILGRTLSASPVSAYVAAIGYGLSGYILGMGSALQYQVAAATAPWTSAPCPYFWRCSVSAPRGLADGLALRPSSCCGWLSVIMP